MNEIVSFPDYQSALRASRRRRPHRTRRVGRCTRAYSCGPLLSAFLESVPPISWITSDKLGPTHLMHVKDYKEEIPGYRGARGVDAQEGPEGWGDAAVGTVAVGTLFTLSIHSPAVAIVLGGAIIVGVVAWLINRQAQKRKQNQKLKQNPKSKPKSKPNQ
ncbi:unnamed protein product [Oppiella nova]|uniref:Uncharacterized protein n=1 Tax=Oppiella nova TaxID=334625 RepID=A0A7R9M940_9ACAR|nr:unnamed protein product [Oppiella nova]CAG2172522.1 unnamed protein product [Oppiella nova]